MGSGYISNASSLPPSGSASPLHAPLSAARRGLLKGGGGGGGGEPESPSDFSPGSSTGTLTPLTLLPPEQPPSSSDNLVTAASNGNSGDYDAGNGGDCELQSQSQQPQLVAVNEHVDSILSAWVDSAKSTKDDNGGSGSGTAPFRPPSLAAFRRRLRLVRRGSWWLYAPEELARANAATADEPGSPENGSGGGEEGSGATGKPETGKSELRHFLSLCKYLSSPLPSPPAAAEEDAEEDSAATGGICEGLTSAAFRSFWESEGGATADADHDDGDDDDSSAGPPPMSAARFTELYDRFERKGADGSRGGVGSGDLTTPMRGSSTALTTAAATTTAATTTGSSSLATTRRSHAASSTLEASPLADKAEGAGGDDDDDDDGSGRNDRKYVVSAVEELGSNSGRGRSLSPNAIASGLTPQVNK